MKIVIDEKEIANIKQKEESLYNMGWELVSVELAGSKFYITFEKKEDGTA